MGGSLFALFATARFDQLKLVVRPSPAPDPLRKHAGKVRRWRDHGPILPNPIPNGPRMALPRLGRNPSTAAFRRRQTQHRNPCRYGKHQSDKNPATLRLGRPAAYPADVMTPAPGRRFPEADAPTSGMGHTPDAVFPELGTHLLHFELIEHLGRGEFARVYLAHPGISRQSPRRGEGHDRAQRRTANLARLRHTNIVPVYSVHETGQFQVLCMPYLGRVTLEPWNRELPQHREPATSGSELLDISAQDSVIKMTATSRDSATSMAACGRRTTCRGAFARPPQRDSAPRHQTRERAVHRRRPADAAQLQRRGRSRPLRPGCPDRRHRSLHGPRTPHTFISRAARHGPSNPISIRSA